jgi:hypothetical protein
MSGSHRALSTSAVTHFAATAALTMDASVCFAALEVCAAQHERGVCV